MRENLIIQVVEEGEQINLVIDDAAYTISTWGNMLGEIENQTDLMEILDGKLDAAEVTDEAEPGKVLRLNEHGQLVADVIGNATTATEVAWDGVSSKPPTFPPAAHNLLSHPDWPGDVDLVQLAALAGVTGPIQTQINAKQDPLTAGDNISIDDGVISATVATYTAGDNISIDDGVISATDTTYTAGDNIDITSEVITYVPTFPIMQPNRINQSVTIPDGYNAVMFGDFEIVPGVTIECVGNANFIALG